MFKVTKSSLAAGAVIAAASFPSAAQARWNLNPPTVMTASAPAPPASGSAIRQTGVIAQPGFQWGDAGIGAGGAAVLLAAGVGTVGIARRRRGHRPMVG